MIGAWLAGMGDDLMPLDCKRLREEISWAIAPFNSGRDPAVIAVAEPLLELLDLGVTLQRSVVHELLGALIVEMIGGWQRMAASFQQAGLSEAAEVARGAAAELMASAELHAGQGAGARAEYS